MTHDLVLLHVSVGVDHRSEVVTVDEEVTWTLMERGRSIFSTTSSVAERFASDFAELLLSTCARTTSRVDGSSVELRDVGQRHTSVGWLVVSCILSGDSAVVLGPKSCLVKVDTFTRAKNLLTVEHDVLEVSLEGRGWSELKTEIHLVKRSQEAEDINVVEVVDWHRANRSNILLHAIEAAS